MMRLEKFALSGAIVAAFSAGLCCIGPVLFTVLGLGAFGAASVFTSLRPYLLTVATIALAYGFYRIYFQRGKCEPGEACSVKPTNKINHITLWVAVIAVAAFALSPYYVGHVAVALIPIKQLKQPTPTSLSNFVYPSVPETVTVEIEGMTCESCEVPIKKVLDNIQGVHSAEVSFKKNNARIQFDPKRTNLDKIKRAIGSTGYKAK